MTPATVLWELTLVHAKVPEGGASWLLSQRHQSGLFSPAQSGLQPIYVCAAPCFQGEEGYGPRGSGIESSTLFRDCAKLGGGWGVGLVDPVGCTRNSRV